MSNAGLCRGCQYYAAGAPCGYFKTCTNGECFVPKPKELESLKVIEASCVNCKNEGAKGYCCNCHNFSNYAGPGAKPKPKTEEKPDPVNHPSHYKFPGGVEVIQLTRHLTFNRGNAVKYLCRAGKKDDELQDLKKALFYVQDEIERLT